MKWNKCKDEMPDKPSRQYMYNKTITIPYITWNGKFVQIASFYNYNSKGYFGHYNNGKEIIPRVTHWAKLPEPPE